MKKNIRNKIDSALKYFKEKQLTDAEIFFVDSKQSTVKVHDEKVEDYKLSSTVGFSIRILKDKRLGFIFSTDISDDGIKEAIDKAEIISRYNDPDEALELAAEQPVTEFKMDFDDRIKDLDLAKREDLAFAIEKAAREFDTRIKAFNATEVTDIISNVYIANSKGLNADYHSGIMYGGTLPAASDGEGNKVRNYWYESAVNLDDFDPVKIGEKAAERTVSGLNARDAYTCKKPAIITNEMASRIFKLLSSGLSGESVFKGKSLFAGKKGKQVSSSKMTIIDDPHIPNSLTSYPFDAEGVAGQKTVLIENGILKNYLHNIYSANLMKEKTTGNASRTLKSVPYVGASNIYIKKGNISVENMMKNTGEGFIITKMQGLHTTNPISGDFSVAAEGFYFKNGEIEYPVKGMAVAGNIVDFLQNVEEIADDLSFDVMINGGCSFLLNELSISGK